MIKPSTLDFLRDIAAHNDRDWFKEHKHRYETARENMIEVAESLFDAMSEHDNLVPVEGKKMIFRIYRDVRFSKNKAPYKDNMSGFLKRATEELRGGYYFEVKPGNLSFQGGGFWAPDKEDLLRMRTAIAADDQPMREIIADPEFQKYFGQFQGAQLKTAPKGFPKDHPAIDLLRYKSFVLYRHFTDDQILSESYIDLLVEGYQAMRPFFDYMSEVLTTDGNGLPLG